MARRLLLVIMIDALGHRIVTEQGRFPFLEAPDGPVRAVCGYSSACIPSLLSGRLPQEHGHWAMYLRDPRHSFARPYRLLIRVVAGLLGRPGLTRRLVHRLLARARIGGYFNLYAVPPTLLPHFDLCEKRDLYAPGALTLETPFDVAARLGVPHAVWSWKTPEAEARRALEAHLRRGEEEFLFFYTARLDAVMHATGTRSAETRACLADYEDFVERMLALAGERYDEVRLLVFGDHGMADVRGVHDLLTPLAELPYRVPRDLLYFVDSTMVRVWYFREGVRPAVEALLGACPYGRLLDDAACERLGILFADRRYGETIFVTDPGEILVPSFMGTTAPRAMHGYLPDDVDSNTVLLANFPHSPVPSILEIGPLLKAELEALAVGATRSAAVASQEVGGFSETGDGAPGGAR